MLEHRNNTNKLNTRKQIIQRKHKSKQTKPSVVQSMLISSTSSASGSPSKNSSAALFSPASKSSMISFLMCATYLLLVSEIFIHACAGAVKPLKRSSGRPPMHLCLCSKLSGKPRAVHPHLIRGLIHPVS